MKDIVLDHSHHLLVMNGCDVDQFWFWILYCDDDDLCSDDDCDVMPWQCFHSKGSVPVELSALNNLRNLDLRGNSLAGDDDDACSCELIMSSLVLQMRRVSGWHHERRLPNTSSACSRHLLARLLSLGWLFYIHVIIIAIHDYQHQAKEDELRGEQQNLMQEVSNAQVHMASLL